MPTNSRKLGFGMIGKIMMTGALIIFGVARLFDGDYFQTIVCEALAFILMES
jgi:hypothetical protein